VGGVSGLSIIIIIRPGGWICSLVPGCSHDIIADGDLGAGFWTWHETRLVSYLTYALATPQVLQSQSAIPPCSELLLRCALLLALLCPSRSFEKIRDVWCGVMWSLFGILHEPDSATSGAVDFCPITECIQDVILPGNGEKNKLK
jgi:hypothetical protein